MFKSTIKIYKQNKMRNGLLKKDDMNEVLWTNEQATHCGMTLPFYGLLKLQTKNFLD
jgi:hypothetical protein